MIVSFRGFLRGLLEVKSRNMAANIGLLIYHHVRDNLISIIHVNITANNTKDEQDIHNGE